MFDSLKKNIEQEKKIVADMRSVQAAMLTDVGNRGFYLSSLRPLKEQLFLLNRAVPDLLKEWSPFKKAEDERKDVKDVKKATVSMTYVSPATKEKRYVTINKKDKAAFLEKLKLSEGALSGIRKLKSEKSGEVIHKPSVFAKASNTFFRKYSDKVSPYFGKLGKDLKKGNIRFLMSTYLSMGIMASVIAFFAGLLIYGSLLIVDLGYWSFFFLPSVWLV